MTTDRPLVGEISSDGQFRWDGQDWTPLARGYREPTAWTLPMQRVTAVYLVVYALVQVVTNLLFVTQPALERTIRAANPQMPDEEVRSAAALGFTLGWVTVAIIAAAVLVLAVGSVRGWRWAFWADLVALALTSIGVVTNAFALVSPTTQPLPPAAIALALLFSLVALALLVWFVVAAARYGPWAMRRPGAG